MDDLVPPVPARTRSKRAILIEMCVVSCLGLIPATINSLYSVLNSGAVATSFAWSMWLTIVFAVQVAVPLLYILWKSGESWGDFGIKRPRYFLDPLLGIGVVGIDWIMFSMMAFVAAPFIDADALREAADLFATPQGPGGYVLLVVAMLANAFSEELLVRAYLLTRLRHLGLSAAPAVFIASALWAAYHIYQGVFYATNVFLMGIVFGVIFLVTRRIWPLVIAHTLYALLAYIGLAVS